MTARLLATVAFLAAAQLARAQATEAPPPPPPPPAAMPAPPPAPATAAFGGQAVGPLEGPYLQARLGVYMNKSADLEGINNGFHLEGAFGYRLHPNLALEAGVGWYKGSTDPQSVNGVSVTASYSDLPVTLSGKLIFPAGVAEAYLLGGVGLHNVRLEAEGSAGGNTAKVSSSDTPFGYHVGGGITVSVSPRVAVAFEVRYLMGRATFSAGGDSISGDIDALFVTGGLLLKL